MIQNTFIADVIKAIDSKDAKKLVSFMTEDAQFRFANIPALEGKKNIEIFLENFFPSIKSLEHSDIEYWQSANVWFVTGYVTYTRLNGSQLRVPFADLFKMNGTLIKDFLIFVDNSELYK